MNTKSYIPYFLNHCARYFFRLHVQFICQPEIDRRETVRTQTNARLTGTVIAEPPRPVVSQLPPGKELTPDQSRIFKVQNYSPVGRFLLSNPDDTAPFGEPPGLSNWALDTPKEFPSLALPRWCPRSCWLSGLPEVQPRHRRNPC